MIDGGLSFVVEAELAPPWSFLNGIINSCLCIRRRTTSLKRRALWLIRPIKNRKYKNQTICSSHSLKRRVTHQSTVSMESTTDLLSSWIFPWTSGAPGVSAAAPQSPSRCASEAHSGPKTQSASSAQGQHGLTSGNKSTVVSSTQPPLPVSSVASARRITQVC